MTRVTRAGVALLLGAPACAWAHAFDDRYDLPAPLPYFVAGAVAAVALSFAVAALFARRAPDGGATPGYVVPLGAAAPLARIACGAVSLALLALTLVAGLYGTRDPVMNLAPTLVWIVFWAGLSLVVACLGNVWPLLDPWRALHALLAAGWRKLGGRGEPILAGRYPETLGAWPAVALLLGIAWLEVVYAEGAEPRRLVAFVLAWSAITLGGRLVFGSTAWERNADVFSIYFDTLGRFAPLGAGPGRHTLALRAPGTALSTDVGSFARVAFVLAMLSTVLFDGLLGGETWWALQAAMVRQIPALAHERSYVTGTLGLAGIWLTFLAAYWLACAAAARMAAPGGTLHLARAFALTLVPIAVGYNVAHNFSSLLMQGQQVIPLLSDPLGRHWNLFGTAGYAPRIGLIDARATWFVAVGAIVAGHGISIWLAHRVALREFRSARVAIAACVPLTVLMLLYTAVSLTIIAEPMVKLPTGTESSTDY